MYIDTNRDNGNNGHFPTPPIPIQTLDNRQNGAPNIGDPQGVQRVDGVGRAVIIAQPGQEEVGAPRLETIVIERRFVGDDAARQAEDWMRFVFLQIAETLFQNH